MPKGSKPGEYRGGRKKGTLNKATKERATIDSILLKTGCEPAEIQALIAMGRVPCGTCIDKDLKPTGKTFYRLPAGQHSATCAVNEDPVDAHIDAPGGGKLHITRRCNCDGIGQRVCESCWGTLWERIEVGVRQKASAELMRYRYQQLKAVEMTGADGAPIQHAHTIKFVE